MKHTFLIFILIIGITECKLSGQINVQYIKHCSSPSSNDGEINISVIGSTIVSYQWSHGPTTEDVSNLSPGVYFVEVISEALCRLQLKFEIRSCEILNQSNYSPLTIQLSSSGDPLQNQGVVEVETTAGFGRYYYSWTGPNGELFGDSILNNLGSGLYCVTVSDGCSEDQDCIDITNSLWGSDIRTDVDMNSSHQFQWNLYPNPFDLSLTLSATIDENGTYSLCVLDLQGHKKLEFKIELVRGKSKVLLEGTEILPPGMYIFELTNEDKIKSQRLISKIE